MPLWSIMHLPIIYLDATDVCQTGLHCQKAIGLAGQMHCTVANRDFIFLLMLPALVLYILCRLEVIPESPRFLYLMGKREEGYFTLLDMYDKAGMGKPWQVQSNGRSMLHTLLFSFNMFNLHTSYILCYRSNWRDSGRCHRHSPAPGQEATYLPWAPESVSLTSSPDPKEVKAIGLETLHHSDAASTVPCARMYQDVPRYWEDSHNFVKIYPKLPTTRFSLTMRSTSPRGHCMKHLKDSTCATLWWHIQRSKACCGGIGAYQSQTMLLLWGFSLSHSFLDQLRISVHASREPQHLTAVNWTWSQ